MPKGEYLRKQYLAKSCIGFSTENMANCQRVNLSESNSWPKVVAEAAIEKLDIGYNLVESKLTRGAKLQSCRKTSERHKVAFL